MIEPLLALVVFGAEAHPPESMVAQLAVPLGILVFFGSTYLLVRANLGTKRGYLVTATTFFGFMMLFSLFWAFGGWGTPRASGPTQMPGQEIDALEPRWIAFAPDSRLAQEPDYEMVRDYPEGFQVFEGEDGDATLAAVEEAVDAGELDVIDVVEDSLVEHDEPMGLIQEGTDDIRDFFAQEEVLDQGFGIVGDLDEPIEIGLAESGGGELLLAVTYLQFDEEEFELVEDGDAYTAFGYFEIGAPLLPAFTFFGIALVLFVLHAWLLDRDERLERRDRHGTDELEEAERVPEPA